MALKSLAILLVTFLSLAASQEVLQPPLITQPDRPQTIYYAEDDTVTIKCSAEGTPKPSYEWQRDDKIIVVDDYIKFDSRTGTLTIPKLTSREEGMFVCRASNLVGGNVAVSFSHPQRILAARVGSFDYNGPKLEVNSNEYSYAELQCTGQGEVVGDKTDITYKWYITLESQQVKSEDGRLFIDNEGTLHFTYTLRTDELQGQDTYHCGISSLTSRLIRLGPAMVLKVQESTPTALKPVIVYSTKILEAILATNADLECVFSGYDPAAADRLPNILWTDSAGNPIVSDGKKYKLSAENRILKIFDVQESDDRNYGCQGTTKSEQSSRVMSVRLNVTSAPIWVQAPKGITVPEGRDVKINCNARSLSGEEPPPFPLWYINGNEFDNVNKPNAVLSDTRKILSINNVTKKNDILCVQCIVSNSIGQTMGDACLNVILPIKITLECDRCQGKSADECSCTNWELSKGDAAQFSLAVTTDPGYVDKLIYEWIVDGDTYKLPKLPPHWQRDPISQVYTINSSDLTDEEFSSLRGNYDFKVFHSYDSQNLNFVIDVKGVTPAPIVSSASVDMWIIGLVIGLVFLLIVIILIIFVLVCRKQQEGVYNLGKKEVGAGLDPANELKDKAFHHLSRPDYEDYEYPDKKPKGELEYDDVPIEGDDESLGEYGDEDDIYFNEEGSFIGNYSVKPSQNNHSAESTI